MSTNNIIESFTVLGEPASKANSRQLVTIRGRPAFIKSKKARNYLSSFQLQCPKLDPPVECDVSVTIKIWYASHRPDLDESVILDAMQATYKKGVLIAGGIYKNDRQVKEKHIFWGLDKENPRAEIVIRGMEVNE